MNEQIMSAQLRSEQTHKIRLATAWLGGCSGCHMSLLDLDERLIDLFMQKVELVYSPIADIKRFPQDVDVTLVEGAVANVDHLELAHQVRANSHIVVSFGDCAVTGNVTSLRNRLGVENLLTEVYRSGPGSVPRGGEADHVMPALLPKVLPLHQVIQVDAFITGCPPDPERIWHAIISLAEKQLPEFEPDMRRFG